MPILSSGYYEWLSTLTRTDALIFLGIIIAIIIIVAIIVKKKSK